MGAQPHLHPLVVPPTAPTVVDRPPAAPDPVNTVQPTFAIGNDTTLSIHSPSLCHDTPLYESGSTPPEVIHYHDPTPSDEELPSPNMQLCTFTAEKRDTSLPPYQNQ